MSNAKPGASRTIIVLVVIAVVIFAMAKIAFDSRRAAAKPAGSQAVQRIAAAVPPHSTRVGAPETAPPTASNPSSEAAQTPQPEAESPRPAASEEKAEPLPGSDLAASLKNGKVTFVDFGAGWCKACKQMEPVIHQLAADYQGKANIVYVDTDKYPDIARSYHIAAIPAQFVFNAKGEQTADHLGYWPIEEVAKALAAAGAAE